MEEEETEGCGPRKGGRGSGFPGKQGRAHAWQVTLGYRDPKQLLLPHWGLSGVTGQGLTKGRIRTDICL